MCARTRTSVPEGKHDMIIYLLKNPATNPATAQVAPDPTVDKMIEAELVSLSKQLKLSIHLVILSLFIYFF